MSISISAVIPTRGDVDMAPIVEALPYDDVVVWDNSVREDLAVYGRYAAMEEAKHDIIYTQDDDCIVTCHAELLSHYEDGIVVANMPYNERWVGAYDDCALLGFGALFHRDLPARAFSRYYDHFSLSDNVFRMTGCDIVFTMLTPFVKVDYGHTDMVYALAPDRVSNHPGWFPLRAEALRRAREVKGCPTDTSFPMRQP